MGNFPFLQILLIEWNISRLKIPTKANNRQRITHHNLFTSLTTIDFFHSAKVPSAIFFRAVSTSQI